MNQHYATLILRAARLRGQPLVTKAAAILAAALWLAAWGSAPAWSAELDFAQAVALAWKANPSALDSAARIEAAQGVLGETRARGLPQLSLQVSAARSNDPLAVLGYRLAQRGATFADLGLGDYSGPGSLSLAPSALNAPGYVNNYDTGLVLDIPLFASGADAALTAAARARLAGAQSSKRSTRNELAFEVLRRYDGVHAAEQLFGAARLARQAAERDLATAESLFQQGVVIRSDVLTAQAHLAEARATEQAAEANYQNALDAFRAVLGLPPGSDIRPGAAVDVPLPAGDLSSLQNEALRNNPQLSSLRTELEARRAEVSAARAANGPRFDVLVRHDWNADTLALRAPSNTIMGVVTWKLFSSGAQSGALTAAVARRRQAEAQLAAAQTELRLKVAQRLRAAHTAAGEARASAEAATQAEEAARLLALRYAQGLSTLDALMNAQARLDRARAQAVVARYQAVLARAALRLTLDQLDPAAAVPAGQIWHSPGADHGA